MKCKKCGYEEKIGPDKVWQLFGEAFEDLGVDFRETDDIFKEMKKEIDKINNRTLILLLDEEENKKKFEELC